MIYGLSTAATLFEPNPRQIAAAGRFFWGSVDGLYTSGGWSHQIKRHASINEYPMSLEIFSLWRAPFTAEMIKKTIARSARNRSQLSFA